MKTILIFHSNQASIADLQAVFTNKCDLYATTQTKTVIDFLEKNIVDVLLIYLPAILDRQMKRQCVHLLKQLRKMSSPELIKIVICSNQEEWPVRKFMKLGVTAIVGDLGGVSLILGF